VAQQDPDICDPITRNVENAPRTEQDVHRPGRCEEPVMGAMNHQQTTSKTFTDNVPAQSGGSGDPGTETGVDTGTAEHAKAGMKDAGADTKDAVVGVGETVRDAVKDVGESVADTVRHIFK
jgi:hypothetical protein